MTTATAVQPSTVKTAIEGFIGLLGPFPRYVSPRDLEDAGKTFANLAEHNLKKAQERMREKGQPWLGTHMLWEDLQVDGVVSHCRDSIEIDERQVRLVEWSRHVWIVEECTVTLTRLTSPDSLERVEWYEFEEYRPEERDTRAHVVINFVAGRITSCTWEGSRALGA